MNYDLNLTKLKVILIRIESAAACQGLEDASNFY